MTLSDYIIFTTVSELKNMSLASDKLYLTRCYQPCHFPHRTRNRLSIIYKKYTRDRTYRQRN